MTLNQMNKKQDKRPAERPGRCPMHLPLTVPGNMKTCPVCHGWVNCDASEGLPIEQIIVQ